MKARFKFLLGALLPLSFTASATDKVTFTVTGKIISKTCSFQSPDVKFDLGQVEVGEHFTGVGSATEWVTEDLVSAGCGDDVSAVYMTFQAEADANDANLFKVNGGATGVALELRSYDGVQAKPDNSTRIRWSPRGNGSVYQYKARYKQTASDVTTGAANANITVNLAYE